MRVMILLMPALIVLLGGCMGSNTRPPDAGPTPAQVVSSGTADAIVHWGGEIVTVENLSDRTRIEVLAFPLNSNGRPRADQQAEGRFIVERAGFLEPHEYASNRLLEVRGRLNGFTDGKVGEATYRYPVVLGESLVLWPVETFDTPGSAAPRVNFGFGFGSYGSGSGIGIGF